MRKNILSKFINHVNDIVSLILFRLSAVIGIHKEDLTLIKKKDSICI